MKLLKKPDILSPAFEVTECSATPSETGKCSSCGHPIERHAQRISAKSGVKFDDEDLPSKITLPDVLVGGRDYAILLDDERLLVVNAPHSEALGGFHVGLDGKIVPHSIWDRNFQPKCPDKRGMVLVAGLFWADIYLLNSEPHIHGTSAAGVRIADYNDPPARTAWNRCERANYWEVSEVLAMHGKQLLSVAEFVIAAQGVAEGKSCGEDPVATCHAEGLRSAWGLEQATGCMWTWSRDRDGDDWCRLLGGGWWTSGAGPRRLYDSGAVYGDYDVAGRGRCDHLILD
jgi:hypothetical protein